jgi:hypothetical protein
MAIGIGNNQFTQVGQIKIGDNINVQRVYRGNDLIFPIFENPPNFILSGNFDIFNGFQLPITNSFTNRGICGVNLDGSFNNSFGVPVISFRQRREFGALLKEHNSNNFFASGVNPLKDFAKLNINGVVDDSFNVEPNGFAGTLVPSVFAIEYNFEKTILYVGGLFNSYKDQEHYSIIALNLDGSINNFFNAGGGFSISSVRDIKVQNDNKIIIGGDFTNYNGTNVNRIVRLNPNGTIDNSFNIGDGFNNGRVNTICIVGGGNIMVGGTFTSYKGVSCGRIIRLLPNGDRDTTFNLGVGNEGFDGEVIKIKLMSANNIMVSGNFNSYRANFAPKLCRINSTGFFVGLGIMDGFNNVIKDFVIYNEPLSLMTAVGEFTTFNNTTANRIVSFNYSNGSVIQNYGTGANGGIFSILEI